jgi:hypothetical protein
MIEQGIVLVICLIFFSSISGGAIIFALSNLAFDSSDILFALVYSASSSFPIFLIFKATLSFVFSYMSSFISILNCSASVLLKPSQRFADKRRAKLIELYPIFIFI